MNTTTARIETKKKVPVSILVPEKSKPFAATAKTHGRAREKKKTSFLYPEGDIHAYKHMKTDGRTVKTVKGQNKQTQNYRMLVPCARAPTPFA